MSCVTFTKFPNHSICTEWKFEGSLNFERNNTHWEKTILYAAITDTLLGLALKVNKWVLTFCFGKSFGIEISLLLRDWFPGSNSLTSLGKQHVLLFLQMLFILSKSKYVQLRQYTVNQNEKMHLQKPEHSKTTSLNSWLENEMHHIPDRLLALHLLPVDSRECQLLWTILHPFNLFCE